MDKITIEGRLVPSEPEKCSFNGKLVYPDPINCKINFNGQVNLDLVPRLCEIMLGTEKEFAEYLQDQGVPAGMTQTAATELAAEYKVPGIHGTLRKPFSALGLNLTAEQIAAFKPAYDRILQSHVDAERERLEKLGSQYPI